MTTPEPAPEFALDAKALARAFNRAGPHYDGQLPVLQRIQAELLERLPFFSLDPGYVLDLGAGTGCASATLRKRFPRALVVALDLAPAMLNAAPRSWWPRKRFQRVAADAAALPLRQHSIDFIYSSLMLPFCDQPAGMFRELARVLSPGGLFLFATLGPDSLPELRQAWASVDAGSHVSQFLDVPQLGDALMQSGLIEPVIDVEQHQLYYPDVKGLMRDLKRLGAQNAAQSRHRGLTGKLHLQQMIAAYEQLRTPAGLPVTFQLVIGAVFAASAGDGGTRAQVPGEFAVPLSALRRPRR